MFYKSEKVNYVYKIKTVGRVYCNTSLGNWRFLGVAGGMVTQILTNVDSKRRDLSSLNLS